MNIPNITRDRPIESIDSGQLIVLCGAGLSMSAPSNLPNATEIAIKFFDKYLIEKQVDSQIRENLCEIASYFHKQGRPRFKKGFIFRIPWEEFSGPANEGHKSLADLLLCGALHSLLSTNFDTMIERWIKNHRKVSFNASLDGDEAEEVLNLHNPLIKIHGCEYRDKENTLWTPKQVFDSKIKKRLESIKKWMNLKLRNKDLVVIGFSTDWTYLNEFIKESLVDAKLNSVLVIDTANLDELEDKASEFFNILKKSEKFEHIPLTSEKFLMYLRTEYSKEWIRRFYNISTPKINVEGMKPKLEIDSLTCDELCILRKDLEGIVENQLSRKKWADENSSMSASVVYRKLVENGAKFEGMVLNLNNTRVRVINALGRDIDYMRVEFDKPPVTKINIVICAGAEGDKPRRHLIEDVPEIKWRSATSACRELGI